MASKRFFSLICALLFVGILVGPWHAPNALAAGPALPDNSVLETVISGLSFVTSLSFAPDGRMFFTQLHKGVYFARGGVIAPAFYTDPGVSLDAEAGFMGVVLDPAFSQNGFVYVFETYHIGGQVTNPDLRRSRVIRLTDRNGVGTDLKVLIDSIPAGPVEVGGKLLFGSDGKLYVSVGYNGGDTSAAPAQDMNSLNGKVLRLNPDGSIPGDNPFPGSPIFTLGSRNIFGLALDRKSGAIWASDNGPECDDKLYPLAPGNNYGWRVDYVCGDWPPPYTPPAYNWAEAIGVTGIEFPCANAFPSLANTLVVGQVNSPAVSMFKVNPENRTQLIQSEATLLDLPDDEFAIAIRNGPDGNLYISTIDTVYRLRASSAPLPEPPSSSLAFRLFVPGVFQPLTVLSCS